MRTIIAMLIVLFNRYRPKNVESISSIFDKKVKEFERWKEITDNDLEEIQLQQERLYQLETTARYEGLEAIRRAEILKNLFK